MLPWIVLDITDAPDGVPLVLRQRGHEFRILADDLELMSNADDSSSRALSTLGCAHVKTKRHARVIVGGLGMGFTARAALDELPGDAIVEVAEFVPAVVEWNRGPLGPLADNPLDDPRTVLRVGDVRVMIRDAKNRYDAILLDVDNGPRALAHQTNNGLYSVRGIELCWNALKPGGVLGVWSIEDDDRYTDRLKRQGFDARVNKVHGSRIGRGRYHYIWIAGKPRAVETKVSRARAE